MTPRDSICPSNLSRTRVEWSFVELPNLGSFAAFAETLYGIIWKPTYTSQMMESRRAETKYAVGRIECGVFYY